VSSLEDQLSPSRLRKRYFWLYIPAVSWVLLVFPLVLPPMPIGPLAVSMAWNRRLEWMSFVRRSMADLGRKPPQRGFPMGWFANVGVNALDLATLGLTHLFVAAELLGALIEKDGDDAERAEIRPVTWAIKWLVLGNVVFLLIYVLCPGLILERMIFRIEKHLYRRHVPVKGTVASESSQDRVLTFESVMTFDEVASLSEKSPVLLFAAHEAGEAEPHRAHQFQQALAVIANDLIAGGVAVRWCNLNAQAPTHYRKIIEGLAAVNLSKPGWMLFRRGKIVARRTAAGGDVDLLVQLARETLGVAQHAAFAPERLGRREWRIRSLQEALDRSAQGPVLLVAYKASGEMEDQTILGIRTTLLPMIRPAVDAEKAIVCLGNTDKGNGDRIREELGRMGKNFHGVVLVRGGVVEKEKKMGGFSTWGDYAKEIHGWLGGERPKSAATVDARYFTVASLEEASAKTSDRFVLLFAGCAGEFVPKILPEIWLEAQDSRTPLCVWNGGEAGKKDFRDNKLSLTSVSLLAGGRIRESREIKAGTGLATRYVDAARGLFDKTGSVA